MVPWNSGDGDKAAHGDLPEFDVKKGPGRQLTDEEKQDITRDEAPRVIHREHTFGGPISTNMATRVGAQGVRRSREDYKGNNTLQSVETAPSSDIRVKNAKARMKERSAKMKSSPNEGHRGPGDEGGGSDQTCGVVRTVQGRVLQ